MTWSGLVQVTTPSACFGMVVREDTVVDCAPYGARWSLGRPIMEVATFWRSRGAEVKAIKTDT